MTLVNNKPRIEQRVEQIHARQDFVKNPPDKGPAIMDYKVREDTREMADGPKAGKPLLERIALFVEPIMKLVGLVRGNLVLNALNEKPTGQNIDASVEIVPGIKSRIGVLFGGMSHGALNRRMCTALVMAARFFGIHTDTGEGGIYEEIEKETAKLVQWASARFGVTLEVLRDNNLGIVIKIGQGAKPGLGGQLPKKKVKRAIAKARKMKMGKDLVSPAPHHDIYSIEDLGQRIEALMLLSCAEKIIGKMRKVGKPVYVKVAATNYVGFIGLGIARMGATGMIIDGAGAGTGAAPICIRDHCGLPVEIAVAWTDRLLREQGLRDNFKLLGGGTIRGALDIVMLQALGADAAVMGTGPLIAAGCAKVDKCHEDTCPANIALHEDDHLVDNADALNSLKERYLERMEQARADKDEATIRKIEGYLEEIDASLERLNKRIRVLDVDATTERIVNYLTALEKEILMIYDTIGIKSAGDLIGNRDVLRYIARNEETREILGVEQYKRHLEEQPVDMEKLRQETRDYVLKHVEALAKGGVAVVGSMGTRRFVQAKLHLRDWLTVNASQVTGPSIDPYREPIEKDVHFKENGDEIEGNGPKKKKTRLSSPIMFDTADVGDGKLHAVVAATACRGAFPIIKETRIDDHLRKYLNREDDREKIFVELEDLSNKVNPELYNAKGLAGLVIKVTQENISEVLEFISTVDFAKDRIICEITSDSRFNDDAVELVRSGVGTIILNGHGSNEPLEVSIVELDNRLRLEKKRQRGKKRPLRYEVNLIAKGQDIYLASDAIKLVCLGVDGVVMDSVLEHITKGNEVGDSVRNYISGTLDELKLFAGANGISDIHGSMTGNRELLRAIDMPPELRESIQVKAAGWG